MNEVDRIIHEPARLTIMALLSGAEEVDFLFLMRETELTKGNLSSHLAKLEEAGYVAVRKAFVDRKPTSWYSLTPAGQKALKIHLKAIEALIKSANL